MEEKKTEETKQGEGDNQTPNTTPEKEIKLSDVKEFVFVNNKGLVRQVLVKSGIQDNMYIQIKSGLKVGDEIVSGPFIAISKTLKDSTLVKIVSKEELFAKKK